MSGVYLVVADPGDLAGHFCAERGDRLARRRSPQSEFPSARRESANTGADVSTRDALATHAKLRRERCLTAEC